MLPSSHVAALQVFIRDVEQLQEQIRKFRQLQAQAMKSCMIPTGAAPR